LAAIVAFLWLDDGAAAPEPAVLRGVLAVKPLGVVVVVVAVVEVALGELLPLAALSSAAAVAVALGDDVVVGVACTGDDGVSLSSLLLDAKQASPIIGWWYCSSNSGGAGSQK
jgi:hypothetical protein